MRVACFRPVDCFGITSYHGQGVHPLAYFLLLKTIARLLRTVREPLNLLPQVLRSIMNLTDTTYFTSSGAHAAASQSKSIFRSWLSFFIVTGFLFAAYGPNEVYAQETCAALEENFGTWRSAVWRYDSNGDDTIDGSDDLCPEAAVSGTGNNYPDAGDTAIITSDIRLDLDEDLSASGAGPLASLELESGSTTTSSGTALFVCTNTLEVSGDVDNFSSGAGNGLLVFSASCGAGILKVGGNLNNGNAFGEAGNISANNEDVYIDVDGSFGNYGTFNLQDGVATFGGNFLESGSSFTSTGSTIYFDGTSQTLSGTGTAADGSSDIEFHSVTLEGSSVLDLALDVSVRDTLIVKLGTSWGSGPNEDADFFMDGGIFDVKQDTDTPSNSGAFYSDEIQFLGGNLANLPDHDKITVSGEVFSAVNVSTTVDLDGTFTVNGRTVITTDNSLTVDTSELLRLNDDASINGTLTANGTLAFSGLGVETFDGNNVQDIIGTGSFVFDAAETSGAGTNVLIDPNQSQAVDIGNLTIATDTEFRVAGNLNVGGNMTINGTFGFSGSDDGILTFDGGASQLVTLGSQVAVKDVVISNSGSAPVSLASGSSLVVESLLHLSNGEFDVSSGDLILLSGDDSAEPSPVNRHAVIQYGGGQLTGSITAQRELETGPDWYFMANPSGTTFNELLRVGGGNQLWIQGVPGSNVPGATRANTNLFTFDEGDDVAVLSSDGAWVTPPSMSATATRGEGFIVYPFSDDDNDGDPDGFSKMIDNVSTVPQSSSFDFNVSATERPSDGNSTIDAEEGWNLLGNPYLTNLSWDDLHDDAKTSDIDDVVYVFSPLDGYEIYNGGSGSPSTTPGFTDGIIAPFQAFFVKVSEVPSPSPSLGISDITNVQSITGSDEFFKSTESSETTREIGFNLELSGVEQDTRLTFRQSGEPQKDKSDAYNLKAPFTDRGVLEVYSVLENGYGLAINNLPYNISDEIRIPISVSAAGCVGSEPFGGTATLTWPTYRNIPSGAELTLIDTETGQSVDLQTESEYTFTLESSTSASQCGSSSLTEKSSEQQIPALPTPEVSRVASAKNGGSVDTRFLIAIQNLPVELGSFTGSVIDSDVELQWTTLSEKNNSGFQIQQKQDGRFTDIESAFVKGAGTTNQPQEYRFRVEDIGVGEHTFRLKQVDVDGATDFSNEVTVRVRLDGNYSLNAYPNPVSNQATIDFSVRESQDVTVELYNTLGQRVRVLHQGSLASEQTKSLQVSADNLSSGLYIVRMRGETFSTTQSITVVK